MERQRALAFLLSLLAVIFRFSPALLGSAFSHVFIETYRTVYGGLSRKLCLKAVSVIPDFRFRNKMIGLLDLMRIGEYAVIESSIIPMEQVFIQFGWVLERFVPIADDAKDVTIHLVECCRKNLRPYEFQYFIKFVSSQTHIESYLNSIIMKSNK